MNNESIAGTDASVEALKLYDMKLLDLAIKFDANVENDKP